VYSKQYSPLADPTLVKVYTGEDADLKTVMKELAKRWPHLKKRLKEALQLLEEDPYSAGEPLTGQYKGYWKLIYEIK